MKRAMALVLALVIALSCAACSDKKDSGTSDAEKQEASAGQQTSGKQTADQTQENSGKQEASASAENASGYFEFADDGTTITGLTEEGEKQTVLVVPASAKAFDGFSFDRSIAEEVSFEADHDIEIGEVFRSAATLKKVTLPAELSVIPESAFSMCEALESISIPAGVTRIDESAFEYCTNLKTVTFEGTKCEVIGEYAFSECGLEEITLPEGLKTVSDFAFEFCEQLTSITFPSTIESIGGHINNEETFTELHFAAGTQDITIDPFAFMTRTSAITVYIAKDSWMDKNQSSWNVGFGKVDYE